MEACQSGRMELPAKKLTGKPVRRFESFRLRNLGGFIVVTDSYRDSFLEEIFDEQSLVVLSIPRAVKKGDRAALRLLANYPKQVVLRF